VREFASSCSGLLTSHINHPLEERPLRVQHIRMDNQLVRIARDGEMEVARMVDGSGAPHTLWSVLVSPDDFLADVLLAYRQPQWQRRWI
jgi:hypothetical protein